MPPIADGPTLNDSLDVDQGVNGLQNFPVLSQKSFRDHALVQVWGSLDSAPKTSFTIEVFTSRDAKLIEASENGPISFLSAQGELLIGSITLTTGASGHAEFHLTARVQAPVGAFLTATATNLTTGDTSEFSRAIDLRSVGK